MTPAPEHLVLFDGECAVCDRAVQFLMDHDTDNRLSYAPLQGTTAAALLEAHPGLRGLDTLVYVSRVDGRETIATHSRAVLALGELLGVAKVPIALARWVPRPLADLGYRAFARSRYALFGRADTCRVPEPGQLRQLLP